MHDEGAKAADDPDDSHQSELTVGVVESRPSTTLPLKNSVDLRDRAVAFILHGGAMSTAYRWLRHHRSLGHVTPKVRGKTTSRKLADAELLAYVSAQPDATLAELGAHFAVSAWRSPQKNRSVPRALRTRAKAVSRRATGP